MNRKRLTAVLAVAVGALGLPAAAQASAYSDQVLASNPLMYLQLGEAPGATVAEDASPNNRDGAYAGDFTLGAAGPFKDAGTSVKLGKTGAISANVPGSSGSVELWVNPDRMVRDPNAPLVAHGVPAADGWALGVGAKRKLVWKIGSKTAPTKTVSTKVSLGSGVWTALTVTWEGSQVLLYRNGSRTKPLDKPATPALNGGTVVVGGDGNGSFEGQFSGRVDEVALYSQVLSASQVAGHFGAARVPVNVTPPSILDARNPAAGDTLTARAGTWTGPGDPSTYSRYYQWQRCDGADENGDGALCADVEGATGLTYDLSEGDECSTFRVVEKVSNNYGSVTAESDLTAVVTPCGSGEVPKPLNVLPPSIRGTVTVGQQLTTEPGTWSNAGAPPTYQWQQCDDAGANCSDIAGATATTYPLADGDACKTLRVVETVSNATGSDKAKSDQTKVVGPCGDGGGDPGDDNGGGGTGTGTGTGTGSGSGSGTGTTGGPGVQPAACLKLLAGRKQIKVRGLGALRLKAAAGTCVTKALPALFKVRRGAKVKSVRYKLDGKRLAGVNRPRFAARLKPSKLRAGKHTLTVRVTPRAGKAKAAKLRLRVALS